MDEKTGVHSNMFLSPAEAVKANMEGAVKKTGLSLGRMLLLAFAAGMFIALGAAASSAAAHSIDNTGLARLVSGAVFPVGLMMIVVAGGELFTGNCLIFMAALGKKVKWSRAARSWLFVFLGNFLGAAAIAGIVFLSGELKMSSGALGAYTIKTAVAKVSEAPAECIASGILCNILVCLAILMTGAAKDIAGKLLAAFFPIAAFVTAGFDHCVANMFYIPAGIFASLEPSFAAKAQELYGITAESCAALPAGMLPALLLVTLGNIIGGMIFVGLLYFLAYREPDVKKSK